MEFQKDVPLDGCGPPQTPAAPTTPHPPTICRCGLAKSYHEGPFGRDDHEYVPRYDPVAWYEGFRAARSTPAEAHGRDAAEWHRYLHAEGILLPDDGINVDGCGPWHHRVFLGESAPRSTPAEARAQSGPSLDAAWSVVERALQGRPYPGTDGPGGWGVQLFGYPSQHPYGPERDDRYHAMATPIIDSHHRNSIAATGLTPVEALQRLAARLGEPSEKPPKKI